MPGRGRHLEPPDDPEDSPYDPANRDNHDDLGKIEDVFGATDAPLSGKGLECDLPHENLAHDRYDARLWRELTEGWS